MRRARGRTARRRARGRAAPSPSPSILVRFNAVILALIAAAFIRAPSPLIAAACCTCSGVPPFWMNALSAVRMSSSRIASGAASCCSSRCASSDSAIVPATSSGDARRESERERKWTSLDPSLLTCKRRSEEGREVDPPRGSSSVLVRDPSSTLLCWILISSVLDLDHHQLHARMLSSSARWTASRCWKAPLRSRPLNPVESSTRRSLVVALLSSSAAASRPLDRAVPDGRRRDIEHGLSPAGASSAKRLRRSSPTNHVSFLLRPRDTDGRRARGGGLGRAGAVTVRRGAPTAAPALCPRAGWC